ncbi:MAG: 4-(cytidine 5'-diphospho)-2-C-methyl-D-erythritol kinase [Acidimicrobiales bacterium]|nr:4-(cytidine 5'-diphospho)-2-C-methyl-D-erythritol kinase [Acidimicrobiales bacterium]
MVTVDLFDSLQFAPGDGLVVTDRSGVTAGHDVGSEGPEAASRIPLGSHNLVRRALVAVGRQASVELEKRIPPGAGLGGGSADAAAVLRWAGQRGPRVLELAVSLGADVPFCVQGGRARVRGIGELVEPQPFEERAFVLAIPPFGMDTGAVYRAWDRLGGPAGRNGNDLEPAALDVEPKLARWKEALGNLTGREPRLAGSGATWFVEGSPESLGLAEDARIAVGASRARLLAVRTIPAVEG